MQRLPQRSSSQKADPGRLRAAHRDEGGQMLIAMALGILFSMMLFALAIDVGFWTWDHRQAQNQADAAAHAAALTLSRTTSPVGTAPTEAIEVAETWLARNGADPVSTCPADPPPDPPGGSVYSGLVFWDRTGNDVYDTVRACVQRQSAVFFAALADVTSVRVSASADASFLIEPIRYAIMAMHPTTDRTLQVGGSVVARVLDANTEEVGGGGTYTNSADDPNALRLDGGAELHAAHHDVVGGATYSPDKLIPSPANLGVRRLRDPFAHIEPPTVMDENGDGDVPADCTETANITPSSGVLPPGRYCGRVTISTGATVELADGGIYVFHQDLRVTGGTLTSNGGEVLLYFTCAWPLTQCDGESFAPGRRTRFDLGGNATTNLMGHCEAGGPEDRCQSRFEGMLVFVDRTVGNPVKQPAEVKISGGSEHEVRGSIYNVACSTTCDDPGDPGPLYNGLIDIQGGSCTDVPELNVTVIAGTIDIHGGNNTCLDMVWDPLTAPAIIFPALVN